MTERSEERNAYVRHLEGEIERLRAELRRFQRIIALDEIAAISQAAGLDELTGEPPIRRPYPLVGPHQGDPPMPDHEETR